MLKIAAHCLFFFCCTFAPVFAADPPHASARVEELKKQYLSLRNTDIRMQRPNDWSALIEDFKELRHSQGLNLTVREHLFLRYATGMMLVQLSGALADRALAGQAESELRTLVHDFRETKSDLVFEAEYSLLSLRKLFLPAEEFISLLSDVRQRHAGDARVGRLKYLESPLLYNQNEPARIAVKAGQRNRKLIVIDAGHGGEDEGALGPAGQREKEETLRFAKSLAAELGRDPRFEIRLVREYDEFVPLGERVNFANDFEADLFLSLHFNASPKGHNSGFQVYFLDNQHDSASAALLEREGSAFLGEDGDYVPRPDLVFMLSDFIQRAKLEKSSQLAEILSAKLGAVGKRFGLTSSGVRTAPFYVLVGVHMPCVLIELLHLDNPADAKLLDVRDFQFTETLAIADAVRDYFAPVKRGTRGVASDALISAKPAKPGKGKKR